MPWECLSAQVRFSTLIYPLPNVQICTNFYSRLKCSRSPPQPNSFRFSSDSEQTRSVLAPCHCVLEHSKCQSNLLTLSGPTSNPGLSRSHSIAASSGNTLLLSPVRDIAIGPVGGGEMEDGATGGGMVGSPPPPGPLGSSATAKASYSLLHGMQVMRK